MSGFIGAINQATADERVRITSWSSLCNKRSCSYLTFSDSKDPNKSFQILLYGEPTIMMVHYTNFGVSKPELIQKPRQNHQPDITHTNSRFLETICNIQTNIVLQTMASTSMERETETTCEYNSTGRHLRIHLPSQVVVRLINTLPECTKSHNINHIPARLKHHMVANAFYSIDEFMESRWDN
ncbi:hypothetical protein J6590_052322 [Homalodisca vitripennis]|nr:hypothetical protein J6590_052322 [Homalodisca vitripennis]